MSGSQEKTHLPRVTYSNIGDDFSSVHALLDRLIPKIREEALGHEVDHWIDGRPVREGVAYVAASPIDRRIVLGHFRSADSRLVDKALSAARVAFGTWSTMPWLERVAAVRRFADELERRKYALAVCCLLEVGKSRMEALGEAEEAIDLARYYCDQMEENGGFIRPLKRAFANEETSDRLRPFGVFGVIAPFNFPLALSTNMISAALVTGNTVVFKPSPFTGLTGSLLVKAADAAGLPRGVLNLVCGHAATGQMITEHSGFDGFAFTGSHKVGMNLLRTAAASRYIRPVIAEMGGKNPTYVTASADLDVAAEGVLRSAFGFQGQKCSSCSKVYVHADVKKAFLDKLLGLAENIKIGNPVERNVFMGPIIDGVAYSRFANACQEACRDGVLLAGGDRLDDVLSEHGFYVTPTIVDELSRSHRLNKEELFLPVLSVLSFTDLGEAIRDGNDTDYGLTAGCYASDATEISTFSNVAEAGVLYLNRASGATTGAWPGVQTFCGWKGSGGTSKGGLGPYYIQQFMREQSLTLWRT